MRERPRLTVISRLHASVSENGARAGIHRNERRYSTKANHRRRLTKRTEKNNFVKFARSGADLNHQRVVDLRVAETAQRCVDGPVAYKTGAPQVGAVVTANTAVGRRLARTPVLCDPLVARPHPSHVTQ